MAQRGFRPTPQQRRRHQNEGMNTSVFNRPAGVKQPPLAKPPKPPATGKPVLGKPGAAPVAAKAVPTGKSRTPDSIYQGVVDRSQRQEESRLGQLEGQEQSVKHEFGIDDPTNPFSRAEGLKRAFLVRQKAASASLASQGQGYSGAHERALGRTRREEEEARAELRRTYEQAIGQIGAAKAGVKFDTEEQRAQAFEDWLARTPDSEAGAEKAPAAPHVDAEGKAGLVGPGGTGALGKRPGSFIPTGGSGNTRSTTGATAVQGEGNTRDAQRLQELRKMLRTARANNNDKRAKVIQNRIKVVKKR